MPGYLLRAPEPDMDRWKAAAADIGQPFAQYARAALDNATSTPVPSFENGWTNVGGKFVPKGMVVLSRECHRNDHRGCRVGAFAAQQCECNCHAGDPDSGV